MDVVNDRSKVILVLPCHRIFVSNAALEHYGLDRIKVVIKVMEAYLQLRMPVRQLPYISMLGTLLSGDQSELSLNEEIKLRSIYGKFSIKPIEFSECVQSLSYNRSNI